MNSLLLQTIDLIEKFLTDECLKRRILLQSVLSDEFCDDVHGYILLLKKKISSRKLNDTFLEIREKTERFLKSAKTNSKKTNIKYALLSFSYSCLLECFDEHCGLNDKIIREIKNKFGKDYIKVIAELDRQHLSKDVEGFVCSKDSHVENLNAEDDCLQKYLLLKKWQDDQHDFFYTKYQDMFSKILKENSPQICHTDPENEISLYEENLEREALLKLIENKKLVEIQTISLMIKLGFKEEIIKRFGGKAYGLARLCSANASIPWTIVLAVGKEVSQDELLHFLPPEIKSFSVRSSADIEDGEKHSFAGMFDSYLDVKRENLLDAIKKVKSSVYNRRLKSYLQANHLENPHMAVVIQSFKEPEFAGVWIGKSLNTGMLEYTVGNGEKIVSGQVTPKVEYWDKKAATKEFLNIKGDFVGQQLIKLQKSLKCIADFEFMILGNKLVMLQFRPATVKMSFSRHSNIKEENVIKGVACSPGKVQGELLFLNSPNEKFEEGKILLAWITDPDWLPHMIKAKGVITSSGGFLCHAGIICRELGIPCVTGVGGDVIKKLSIMDNVKVCLDGEKGTIKLISSKK